MFFSSGCITLLLYGLKASLAATAIPSPISMSDISLAAALLQLPDNSTQSSNNNKTQEQQESLQLVYSNHTLASDNASNFEFSYRVVNTPYHLHLTEFGHPLNEYPLLYLYHQVLEGLQEKVDTGGGSDIPSGFRKQINYSDALGYLLFTWYNQCADVYGSWEDLIPIVKALGTVTTGRGIMPSQYQNRKCICDVYRDMGPGAERVYVGGVTLEGTSVGNEVE